MKPLLIIPPAPGRAHALERLLENEAGPLSRDVQKRFAAGAASGTDAVAVVANGGQFLAAAAMCSKGGVGLVELLFTRTEHRLHGYARRLLATLLAWFDMVGGKRTYARVPVAIHEKILAPAGFRVMHRGTPDAHDELVVLRAAEGEPDDPLAVSAGALEVRDLDRADLAPMFALLQHRPGPDPRVPLHGSALTAATTALELIDRKELGTCTLLGAYRGIALVGFGTVATDPLGDRTYAMQLPHDQPLPALRDGLLGAAQARGYTHVDFPLETLAGTASDPAPASTAPQA